MKLRSRLVRLFLVAQAITCVSHVVPILALASLIGSTEGIACGIVVWAATAARLYALGRDRRRRRWITKVVDLPLFAHWGASFLSTLLFPMFFVAAEGFDLPGGPEAAAGKIAGSAAVAAYAFGCVVAIWSVFGRRHFVRTPTIEVRIEGLPPELDGYRIAHLTDLHIGSYDPLKRGLRWAELANSLSPDLIAVTGDLVTSGVEFYSDAAAVLGALRARDGVFVCLGNHDQWDDRALSRRIEERGPVVLRNEARVVRRGDAALTVAGLDDWYTRKDNLDEALRQRIRGAPTILLAHYPSFFERAASQGVDLVLSGHTHGGQVGLPGAASRINLARLTGQRSRGLVQRGRSHLFVSAGLGTTGPPMRLGVPPEIALLVLRPA